MNIDTPSLISELADGLNATVHEVGSLPDGSGFATMSFPLREDHWLYELDEHGHSPRPPYHLLAPAQSKARQYLEPLMMDAVKYGVKCATMNGREDDFDPDALVGQARNGMFGLHTDTGLCRDPEDAKLFDPAQPGHLGKVLLEALSLALHDNLIELHDVVAAVQPDAIQAAIARHRAREDEKVRELEAWRKRMGLVATTEEIGG